MDDVTVYNVIENADGTFNAEIRLTNNGDTKLEKTSPALSTKAEFKDWLRPKMEKYLADKARREQLLTLANTAIEELKTEVGWPT